MIYPYKSALTAALAAMTLSACASMSAVSAGETFKGETAFEVTPSASWSRLPDGLNPTKGSALTQDGVPLGAVYLVTVENDKAMLDKIKRQNLPRYISGSTELEQIDFLEASLALLGYADLAAINQRPATVDGVSGIQFGLTGKYSNGLEMQGDVLIFEADEQLNVIFYAAPKMHYYEKYKDDAEIIFRSVRFDE
ncbi:hypothetical protein N9M10_05315 [Hellea sp.]|nr:hypothetical protein [Hellea sp.]